MPLNPLNPQQLRTPRVCCPNPRCRAPYRRLTLIAGHLILYCDEMVPVGGTQRRERCGTHFYVAPGLSMERGVDEPAEPYVVRLSAEEALQLVVMLGDWQNPQRAVEAAAYGAGVFGLYMELRTAIEQRRPGIGVLEAYRRLREALAQAVAPAAALAQEATPAFGSIPQAA